MKNTLRCMSEKSSNFVSPNPIELAKLSIHLPNKSNDVAKTMAKFIFEPLSQKKSVKIWSNEFCIDVSLVIYLFFVLVLSIRFFSVSLYLHVCLFIYLAKKVICSKL